MTLKLITNVANEINSAIVMHPKFEMAFKGILELIELSRSVEIPLGATVIAPPGCGKTALTQCIAQALPSQKLLKDDIRSLYVKAEANATVGHFIGKLLRQLGYPATIRASTLYEQSAIICSAVRENGVKVIFIDESQHICRGRRTLSAAAITDWVKQLVDDAGVVIILLGTLELRPLIELNDQLASRAPAHFELKEFEKNEEWIGLLKQLSASVHSMDISSIHTKFSKKLHTATRGTPRTLKQLLITSTKVAIQSGKSTLETEALMHGYTMLFGNQLGTTNLFLYD